jgi:hypothetical protein
MAGTPRETGLLGRREAVFSVYAGTGSAVSSAARATHSPCRFAGNQSRLL